MLSIEGRISGHTFLNYGFRHNNHVSEFSLIFHYHIVKIFGQLLIIIYWHQNQLRKVSCSPEQDRQY